MKTLSNRQVVGNLKALGWGTQFLIPHKSRDRDETYLTFNQQSRDDIEAGDASVWENYLNQFVAQLQEKGFTARWESFVDIIPDYPSRRTYTDPETGKAVTEVRIIPTPRWKTIAGGHHECPHEPYVIIVDAKFTY